MVANKGVHMNGIGRRRTELELSLVNVNRRKILWSLTEMLRIDA
jgi:hypothetical protein